MFKNSTIIKLLLTASIVYATIRDVLMNKRCTTHMDLLTLKAGRTYETKL